MLQGEGDSTTSVSLTITGTADGVNLVVSGANADLTEVVNLRETAMPAQQYTLEDLEQIAQFQVGDELLDEGDVPFDTPQFAQISDVEMAAGHFVGDEMSPGNLLPINSEVKEVVFFVDSSEDLQGVDAAAFDAGENASVASVASAYKAAQLFTQEDLEMLAGFQVGDELLNDR